MNRYNNLVELRRLKVKELIAIDSELKTLLIKEGRSINCLSGNYSKDLKAINE